MSMKTESVSMPIISTSYRLQSASVAILSGALMLYFLLYFKGSSQLQTIVFMLFIGSSMFFVHKAAVLVKSIDRTNVDIINKLNKKYAHTMAESPDDLFVALQSFSVDDRVILMRNLEAAGQSRALFTLHAVMHIVGIGAGAYVMYFYIG